MESTYKKIKGNTYFKGSVQFLHIYTGPYIIIYIYILIKGGFYAFFN